MLIYGESLRVTPAPTYKAKIRTKIWPRNCRVCLVLKHFESYFVQMFVHISALYVGGGAHSHISESTHIPDFQLQWPFKLSELFCAVVSEHAEFPMFSLMMKNKHAESPSDLCFRALQMIGHLKRCRRLSAKAMQKC